MCKKFTGNTNSHMVKITNDKMVLSSRCEDCGRKKSRFINEEEAQGILSSQEIKTTLIKIPLLNVLF